MKVYISGQITGIAPDEATRQFAAAQTELEAQGYGQYRELFEE